MMSIRRPDELGAAADVGDVGEGDVAEAEADDVVEGETDGVVDVELDGVTEGAGLVAVEQEANAAAAVRARAAVNGRLSPVIFVTVRSLGRVLTR